MEETMTVTMGAREDLSWLDQLIQLSDTVISKVKTVAILYGGTSSEREVSLASGIGVSEVLDQEGFSVSLIDTGKEGFIDQLIAQRPDVAFIALHGKGGEDGGIQGFLETMGIPYTQSGIEASALAMDKYFSKVFYKASGLATAPFVRVDERDGLDDQQINSILVRIGLPCVVKPVYGGSSVGVCIAHSREELLCALQEGFKDEETEGVLLVEQFVEGVEVTVPVLGAPGSGSIALPIIEIVPKNAFYDYESKYSEGGSQHIIPARITRQEQRLCEEAAIFAHELFGCSGVSRIDMIIKPDGEVSIIETNTVPGMTKTSLVPDSAKALGLTLGQLYRLLLYYALNR